MSRTLSINELLDELFADKPIKFFDARRKVGMKWGEIETALQEFITLFKFFLSLESKGELPDLETELDSLKSVLL